MGDELTLAIVLGAAVIDSINPCAIGVLLFLTSVMLHSFADKKMLMTLGITYIATVLVVYMLSGLGLIWFQHTLIAHGFAEIIGAIVGAAVIVLGLIEIKEFFWYGKGILLGIAPAYKEKLTRMATQISWLGINFYRRFRRDGRAAVHRRPLPRGHGYPGIIVRYAGLFLSADLQYYLCVATTGHFYSALLWNIGDKT